MKKIVKFFRCFFKHKHKLRFDKSIAFEDCGDGWYGIYTERHKCKCGHTEIITSGGLI